MRHIDCKKYSDEILEDAKQVSHSKTLAIVSVGNDAASQSYIKGKIKDCQYCGIPYVHIKVDPSPISSKQLELEQVLNSLAQDSGVGAIILQLPLPKHWDEDFFLSLIPSGKDVDGFSRYSPFEPCTPEGVVYILKKELGNLEGKSALIIGRGKLVGLPLIHILLDEDCTVSIAHSKSKEQEVFYGTEYDIVICAAGCPNLLDLSKLRGEPIVIDVGVNRVDGKLQGDCFGFTDNEKPNLRVTPVPKGIGLITRAMLMKHVAKINERR